MWLSFVAMASLLLVPASLLAQDLQSGKLGGVCTVVKASGAGDLPDEANASQAHGHCPLCAASWGLLPSGALLNVCTAPALASPLVASADPAARVTGLPFSRAPPEL